MKIKLLQVGKTDDKQLETLIDYYFNKIQHYTHFEIITLKDSPKAKFLDLELLKKEQGKNILAHIQASDYLVLLDEKGKMLSSEEFANYFQKKQLANTACLIFVIGGAFGFSEAVYLRANEKLALSKMTFSHQMVRLFFVEQVYRAFSILKGEKYHHL